MEAYTKFMGKTVEDAVQEACIELGTTQDNLEYNVIVHETKGFLGFGAKQAVIEARMKRSDDDLFDELLHEDTGEKKNRRQDRDRRGSKNRSDRSYDKAEKAVEKAEKKTEQAEKKAEKAAKKAEKKLEDAAAAITGDTPAQGEAGDQDEKNETAGGKSRERAPRVPADPAVATARATDFLSGMFDAMGLEVAIDTSFEDDTLNVELSGEDMGILIGKRGQTLDSVQYLTSLVVNKGKASYVRVKVDTENYRERRKSTLENLAKNIAFKVKKTRRPVYLEPMNPYERRIIHSALQNDPYVTTHSEGEEPLRKVVVTLKKREYHDYDEED